MLSVAMANVLLCAVCGSESTSSSTGIVVGVVVLVQ